MQENEFKDLLTSATKQAKEFSLDYITNVLPAENFYCIKLNLSQDNSNLIQFDLYPEDNDKVIEMADEVQVVETLLRKGKVPVWIDISVSNIVKEKTLLTLVCAGRYTEDISEMYYHQNGTGPFGVKSPNLPIDYTNGRKFNLLEAIR